MSEANTEQAAATNVRKRPLAELVPQETNPRTKDPVGFAALVESIRKHGVEDGAPCAIQPVIVNVHPEFPNQIVGGEMRWRAAQEADFSEIWVREVVLGAEQLHELTIRLNVPAGEWDWDKLAETADGEQLLFFGFKDLEFPSLPADEDIQLEGSEKTVAQAKKPPSAGSTEGPAQESLTRQFQIFLIGDEYDELVNQLLPLLKARYRTRIASEAMLGAAREIAAQQPPAASPDEPKVTAET